MQTWKTLAVAAGMTMAAGSALAHLSVDEDELLGTWQAEISGDDGTGSVRVMFTEDGHYLALAMIDGQEEEAGPVQFWETGTWKLRGSTLTCDATGASEEQSDDERHTVLKIEDIDDESVHFSSDSDPMWEDLEFVRATASPLAGVWEGESEDGTVRFVFADTGEDAGQVSGCVGDEEDAFWGRWEMSGDDEVTLFINEQKWEAGADESAEFNEYAGTIEDLDDDAMSLAIEGLGDEAIDFERVASDPLVGEWSGHVDDSDILFNLEEGGTFNASSGREGEEISGLWTNVGGGMIFLVISDGDNSNTTVLHYRITSADTVMFGEQMDDLTEFSRE